MIAYMKKKRYILVVGIILIGMAGLIFVNNKLDNKETILDEVKLKENKVDNKSFAIMIQKEDKTGYEASTNNTWPTNMIYNSELSGCIDNYGSIIENSLSYNQETNKVTINTRVTSSCYLYFDLDTDAPIVTSSVNNNNSTNATMTISSNEAGTYCINTSNTITDISNCVFTGNITKDVSVTTSIFSIGGDYYVHVKDSAGNIGISNKVTVTLITYAGEELLSISSMGLNTTTAYDGMYRYIGTTANNYVKLGNVLYRIIGITTTTDKNTSLGIEAGQLKLIKAETIGNQYWNSVNSTNVLWAESTMYTYLQSLNVLGKTSIIPSEWSNKIDSVYWNIGDVETASTSTEIIELEDNLVTSSQSKIGLMYLSDYYYAYIAGGETNCSSAACTSWITDKSNDTWTMTRYGKNSSTNTYRAWAIYTNSYVGTYFNVNGNLAVRPVFYLKKDIILTNPDSTGTSTDPFIVS